VIVSWAVGDVVEARWEILEVYRGGGGIVFLLRDTRDDAVWAAKTLLTQPQDAGGFAGVADDFEREARL
jgi:hypothetical protein